MREGKQLYIKVASNKLMNLVIESSQQSQEQRTMQTQEDIQEQSAKKKNVTFAKNLTTTFDEAAKNKDLEAA